MNIPVQSLLNWNRLSLNQPIHPGDRLILNPGNGNKPVSVTYSSITLIFYEAIIHAYRENEVGITAVEIIFVFVF